MSDWKSLGIRRIRECRRRRRPTSTEHLEDRVLLATYTVDTLLDEDDGDSSPGDLSLREAIRLANLAAEEDTITFDPVLFTATKVQDFVYLNLGPLTISQDLKITGPGYSELSINGQGKSRLFQIESGVDVEISGVILGNGNAGNHSPAGGGAIFSAGNLTLREVWVRYNQGADKGGGILHREGRLTVVDSKFENNTAFVSGAGLLVESGDAEIIGTTFKLNSGPSAAHKSGGGGVTVEGGKVTIRNATFANNSAHNYGGGLYVLGGDVTVIESAFTENKTTNGHGAGAAAQGGTLRIIDSVLEANSSAHGGGGVSASGSLAVFISNSRILNNTAVSSGGGVSGTGFRIQDSVIAGNHANHTGGGIAGSGIVVNSTVSRNQTNGWGGGLGSNIDMELIIRNSTIVGNIADADGNGEGTGGGFFIGKVADGVVADVQLFNTIVAGNGRVTAGVPNDIATSSSQQVNTASAFNLIGTAYHAGGLQHGVNGNIVGNNGDGTRPISQILDPILKNNGGPTPTHALVANGPAVNAGSNALAVDSQGDPLVFDQRGPNFQRIVNGTSDIGAFEYGATRNRPEDLLIFDEPTGRWKVGVNTGDKFTWIDGPRWNSTLDWQTWTGDVNGDGFLDGLGFSSGNALFIALNDGQGNLTTVSAGSFSAVSTFQYPMVGDFDGNGTMDLLAMHSTGNWFSRRWNGSAFETAYFGKWTPAGWTGFAVGDFNGDAVDDVIGLRDGNDGTRANWMYGLSNSTPVGRRFHAQFAGSLGSSAAQTGWHNILVGNFNGDTRDDLLVQTGSGVFWYAVSNGASIVEANPGARRLTFSPGSNFPSTTFTNSFRLADVNGDGLDDIVSRLPNVGQFYDGEIRVGLTAFNNVASMISSIWGQWGRTVNWGTEIVGDFNGDGRDDLAGLDVGRQLTFVSLSDATAFGLTLGFGPIFGLKSITRPGAAGAGRLSNPPA